MSARLCHICERPRDEWAIEEGLLVAYRNGLYHEACESCWGKWPDSHKTFPARGFGRWPDEMSEREHVTLADIVQAEGPA